MKELIKGFVLATVLVYGGLWITTHYDITSLSSLYKFLINNFGTILLNTFFLQLLICIIIITKNFIVIKFSNSELKVDFSVGVVSKCIIYLTVAGVVDLSVWISYNLALKLINIVF